MMERWPALFTESQVWLHYTDLGLQLTPFFTNYQFAFCCFNESSVWLSPRGIKTICTTPKQLVAQSATYQKKLKISITVFKVQADICEYLVFPKTRK